MVSVLAGLAAFFAYLSWVRMVTPDRAKLQQEMTTRLSGYQPPMEVGPKIYPAGATVIERNDLRYRIMKTLFPVRELEGHTTINIQIFRPEATDVHRVRKDIFSEESSFAGCTVGERHGRSVNFHFDSIDPQQVQEDFMNAVGLLVGDYEVRLPENASLAETWDAAEEAPDF